MRKLIIKNLNAQFFFAVWGNDVDTCRDLIINQKISVHGSHLDRNCDLFTIPIFVAIQKNYKELFDACIEDFNANINIEWKNNLPIDLAYHYNRTYMLEKLIEKKSDKSEYYSQKIDEDYYEKIFNPARRGDIQEVRRLLSEKKTETLDYNGKLQHLLTIAVKNDDLGLAKMLIEEFKFDQYKSDIVRHMDPARKSCYYYSIKCMKYFAEKDPKFKKAHFFDTEIEYFTEVHSILYKAIIGGDTNLFVETYKKNRDASKWFEAYNPLYLTLLHIAVYHNKYDIVKAYIDILGSDKYDYFESYCELTSATPLLQAFIDRNFKIMQLLIEKGAEYDSISDCFETFGLEVRDM